MAGNVARLSVIPPEDPEHFWVVSAQFNVVGGLSLPCRTEASAHRVGKMLRSVTVRTYDDMVTLLHTARCMEGIDA